MDIIYDQMSLLPYRIAYQCAPLLSGIKISNLLILSNDEVGSLYHTLDGTGIYVKELYHASEKATYLLYDKKKSILYLRDAKVQQFLARQGYEVFTSKPVLDEVSNRFSKFRKKQGEFPNELGVLLGYPVEDVIGFIENKGVNCLYSGYWKVYDNLTESRKVFQEYREAKNEVVKKISNGFTIKDIIHEYQIQAFETYY